ncbi:MAG: AGE family epimerase/isomerase [Pseudomonadota bacterium]
MSRSANVKADLPASFLVAAERYATWLRKHALPYWATSGRDVRFGGSIERVEADGRIDPDAPLRLRVQARQLFVYASAVQYAWFESAPEYVDALWNFMERHGRHATRDGYIHTLIWPDGDRDQRLDLYDHAFFLLAAALHHRVTQATDSRTRADGIVAMLDERLAAVSGGWHEGDYAAPYRRQNPHMHLFEAFMAWYETDNDPAWLDRATQMYALFDQHFFDREHGLVLEYFGADWSRPEDVMAQVAEPGHLLEWVWLLDWYQRLSNVDTEAAQRQLFATAMEHGRDGHLVIDELNSDASPRTRSKRLWPMTEFIKAACVRGLRGDVPAFDAAAAAIDTLFERFLVAEPAGAYIDRLDDNNVVTDARAPASSLYHLTAALIEVERVLAQD